MCVCVCVCVCERACACALRGKCVRKMPVATSGMFRKHNLLSDNVHIDTSFTG